MEIAAGAGILAVFVGYFRGRYANSAIATAISKALIPELRRQFSRVEGGSLVSVDAAAYELWCSGRLNTLGLLVELSLKHRQDVLTSLLSSMSGSGLTAAAGSPFAVNVDTITLSLRVDGAAPAGVLAAYPAKQREEVEEKYSDIATFPQTYVAPGSVGLPPHIEVLTDAPDFARAAVPASLAAAFSHPGADLNLLYLSEHPAATAVIAVGGDAAGNEFPHILRLEAKLPSEPSAAAAFVVALLRGLLDGVDGLARLADTMPVSARVPTLTGGGGGGEGVACAAALNMWAGVGACRRRPAPRWRRTA